MPARAGCTPDWTPAHRSGPVYAASSSGTVMAAGPASGFGQWVKIQPPRYVSTVYGHLSSWTVTVGQAVQAGQVITSPGQ